MEPPLFKTIWIKAHFQKFGYWAEKDEPTGEVKRNLLGGEKLVYAKKKMWIETTDYRDDLIDGERLSRETEIALNELDSEGFDVLSITPAISGHCGIDVDKSGTYPTSWGYSHTEGIMIVAKKRSKS